MGYKVTKDGEIICDTVEEAIALAQRIAGQEGRPSKRSDQTGERDSRWTESRYREFMSLLKGHQKDLINLLLDSQHGRTDSTIRQALHIDSNLELAGITAGLAKNAKKVGIMSTGELFKKEVMHHGDERVLEYTIAEPFRSVAERVRSKEK